MTPVIDSNLILSQQSFKKYEAENIWSLLYEDAIEVLAKAESDHIFESATCEQTAIIIKNILRFSQKTVCIYVKELDSEISDHVPGLLDIIREFLEKRGTKLWILVDSPFSENEGKDELGLYNLSCHYAEKFKVKVASKLFKESLVKIKDELSINQEMYFAVGDSKAFQIMTIQGNYKGYGGFNNRNLAERLQNSFTEHFSSSDEYFKKSELLKETVLENAA